MKKRGFTLVEVLIVVVIMAVLAATVLPQFTNSADQAKEATALYNLNSLRSQIAIYKAHHGGLTPSGTLAEMLGKTDRQGNIGTGAEHVLGPYLRELPMNTLNDKSTVEVVTGMPTSGDGSHGWQYNATTGEVWLDDAGLYGR